MSTPYNSRFKDMGGGNIAELIAHQVQLFWDPSKQEARVLFNGGFYMKFGDKFQQIGQQQDILEQNLANLLHLRLVPQGAIDPVTGADLSQISMAGMVIVHKYAYDFFHNVKAGTPGYPLMSTITGEMPTYQEESQLEAPIDV